MKLLLDTHLLLWAAGEPKRLPKNIRTLLEDMDNELLFSVASLWEVAIKSGLGRKDFRVEARLLRRGLLDNGYSELPIVSDHVVAIESLPPIHKDPLRSYSGGAGGGRGHYAAYQRSCRGAVPWPDTKAVRKPSIGIWANAHG